MLTRLVKVVIDCAEPADVAGFWELPSGFARWPRVLRANATVLGAALMGAR